MEKRTSYPVIPLLLLLLILSTALAIGLTYVPCYSSLCSEDFFPYETRLHLAFYYALLASIGAALLLRAHSPTARRWSRTHLTGTRPLPVLGSRVSAGGFLLGLWAIGLTIATTGFWYGPAHDFWAARADPLDWAAAKIRLLVTTITGHHVDVVLGLMLIPVGRNSLVGRAFELHQSTLLLAHKLLSYATIFVALIHGAVYYVSLAGLAFLPITIPSFFPFPPPLKPGLPRHDKDSKALT
jgi:ferric-chelate reductase